MKVGRRSGIDKQKEFVPHDIGYKLCPRYTRTNVVKLIAAVLQHNGGSLEGRANLADMCPWTDNTKVRDSSTTASALYRSKMCLNLRSRTEESLSRNVDKVRNPKKCVKKTIYVSTGNAFEICSRTPLSSS